MGIIPACGAVSYPAPGLKPDMRLSHHLTPEQTSCFVIRRIPFTKPAGVVVDR